MEKVGISPAVRSLSNNLTTSGNEPAPSFCIILDRCALIVFSLVPNSKPTCLLRRPWAMRKQTYCSLGERLTNAD